MPKDGFHQSAPVMLSSLKPGTKGFISAVGQAPLSTDVQCPLEERLREIGFDEGLPFELLHQGPFGRDPLAVQVDGMIVALRRAEASMVSVELEEAAA